jgi:hypothetical protein
MNNLLQKMYPVLKGNAAYGGEINPHVSKHLLLEFNCLGIEGTDDVKLVIQSDNFEKIEMTFRKQCSTSNYFSASFLKL